MTQMMKYIKNVGYILHHKYLVLIECWKEGLYWQGLVHDLSKFSPAEFSAYAWNFFADSHEKRQDGDRIRKAFLYAWLHHQHKNKHHWQYWVVNPQKQEALPMPEKYILEMICDWRAMSRKFGDSGQEFFKARSHKMLLHPESFERIHRLLNIEMTSS